MKTVQPKHHKPRKWYWFLLGLIALVSILVIYAIQDDSGDVTDTNPSIIKDADDN